MLFRWFVGGLIMRVVFKLLRNWRQLLMLAGMIIVLVWLYKAFGHALGLDKYVERFVANVQKNMGLYHGLVAC